MGNNPEVKDPKVTKETFRKKFLREIERDQELLIQSIILEAKKGDATALKNIFAEVLKDDEETEQELPITDEQYKQIITMAAKQLASVSGGFPS